MSGYIALQKPGDEFKWYRTSQFKNRRRPINLNGVREWVYQPTGRLAKTPNGETAIYEFVLPRGDL